MHKHAILFSANLLSLLLATAAPAQNEQATTPADSLNDQEIEDLVTPKEEASENAKNDLTDTAIGQPFDSTSISTILDTADKKNEDFGAHIDVTTPGQLQDQLNDDEWIKVTHLTVTGELNDTDIVTIQEKGKQTLEILDLSSTNIDEIDSHEFEGFKRLTTIILPYGLKRISAYAFADCQHLQEIEIPNSVTQIGEGAFDHCTALKNIVLPNSQLSSIGKRAFRNCPIAGSLSLPNSLHHVGEEAFSGTAITAVTANGEMTEISAYSFQNCHALTNIYLSGNITAIEEGAFENCENMEKAQLPAHLTKIENGAFSGCSRLKEIICPTTMVPTVGSETFRNVDKKRCRIEVNAHIMKEYKESTAWKEFSVKKIKQ